MRDMLDGTSNTISLGERNVNFFDSTWTGFVYGGAYAPWRILGWTGEPPNNSIVHFHAFAQFNSAHRTVTHFAFLDGSVQVISNSIVPEIFKGMGSVRHREIVTLED